MRSESRQAKLIAAVGGVAMLAALSPSAHAVTSDWTATSAGTYDWTNPLNWSAGVPGAVADVANLSVNLGGNVSVALPGNVASFEDFLRRSKARFGNGGGGLPDRPRE